MKRWGIVLGAAVVCLMMSGQASHANFRVVKASWGGCAIWNYAGGKPWGPVTVVSKSKKTFAAALKTHGYLVKKKICKF
jgi:hypothetical protein